MSCRKRFSHFLRRWNWSRWFADYPRLTWICLLSKRVFIKLSEFDKCRVTVPADHFAQFKDHLNHDVNKGIEKLKTTNIIPLHIDKGMQHVSPVVHSSSLDLARVACDEAMKPKSCNVIMFGIVKTTVIICKFGQKYSHYLQVWSKLPSLFASLVKTTVIICKFGQDYRHYLQVWSKLPSKFASLVKTPVKTYQVVEAKNSLVLPKRQLFTTGNMER
jgi:hypothetical protein